MNLMAVLMKMEAVVHLENNLSCCSVGYAIVGPLFTRLDLCAP